MDNLVELLLRGVEIKLKQEEIQKLETAASQTQGITQLLLQAQADNSKQTLEVIKLTNTLRILTMFLVVIGLAQLYITWVKP